MRKANLLGASAAIAVSLGVTAIAADDPIAGVYGNTVFMTDSKGDTTSLWIKPDGTFSGASSKGQKYSGKWRLSDDSAQFCTTPDLPASAPKDAPAPKEHCFPFEAGHKVGDKWEQPEPNGGKKIVEIKAGM